MGTVTFLRPRPAGCPGADEQAARIFLDAGIRPEAVRAQIGHTPGNEKLVASLADTMEAIEARQAPAPQDHALLAAAIGLAAEGITPEFLRDQLPGNQLAANVADAIDALQAGLPR